MTARRAMKEIPDKARPAIIDELTNLTKKGVLTGRHWGDLTPTQRLRVLRSHTNCDKQRYYLDLAKSRGRIGSIASQQCLYQLSILCK